MLRKLLSAFFALLMIAVLCGNTAISIAISNSAISDFDAKKSESANIEAKNGHADSDDVRIMVELDGKALLDIDSDVKVAASHSDTLKLKQKKAAAKIESAIGKDLTNAEYFSLLMNGFSFDGKAEDIDTINSLDGMLAYVVPSFGLIEPEMDTSAPIVGAPSAWSVGKCGTNTAIAIIDTGIRSSHSAFSVTPSATKYTQTVLQSIIDTNGESMHAGTNTASLYKSAKIPFAYDYYYGDYVPNHTASDHGTHVAGIAAGNNGGSFRGIAYDAQIVVMQVFSSSGGAPWDILLMALEDCAYLGVDAANMSLGSTSGFSTYSEEGYAHAFELLDTAGVMVAAAAGNDGTSATGNAYGGNQLAMNPDYGLVSAPSTLPGCLSVASSDNRDATSGYIYAYGNAMSIHEPDSGASGFYSLMGGHDYVYCGLGETFEIPSNVSGKIAIVRRGELTFTQKAANVASAGAIGIVVFNNISGALTNISVTSRIPFVTLPLADGETLVSSMTDGVGYLEVRTGNVGAASDSISDFSSRGTTSDLLIKPEITAPGGNITSSIGFSSDTSYATWSGTSMATPHIAGGMSIVKSYVLEKMPDLTSKQAADIAMQILMGTATPLRNELVRSQGAGMMNLEDAISTTVYLSVNNSRPKLEIGDSEDCRWTFSVTLTNFGDSATEYSLRQSFAIDSVYQSSSLSPYYVSGAPRNVTGLVEVACENSIVTIPAGSSVDVTMSIDASAVMEQYGSPFSAGAFLEGFVYFENENEQQSVPLLGYMGDWDYPSVLDRGFYWQSITGETNYSSNGSIDYNTILTQRNGSSSGVGLNPYAKTISFDEFNPDWGAISPNADGTYESITKAQFALLRNVYRLDVSLDRENGEQIALLYQSGEYEFRKDYYDSGYSYCEIDLNYAGAGLSEGETAYINITPLLDHEGYLPENNECGTWSIPITFDTTAPSVFVENGRLGVYDEHYVAYVAVYSDKQQTNKVFEETLYGKTRGETNFIENMSGTVYVYVGDYAGNEETYIVDTETGRVATETVSSEGFESNPILWNLEENTASAWTWGFGNSTFAAHSGNGCIYSENAGSVAISQSINATESGTFAKLHVTAKDTDASYRVYMRNDSGDTLIYEGNALVGDWQPLTFDIASGAGNIRLVFEHTSGGALLLDDFEVQNCGNDLYMLVFMSEGAVWAQSRFHEGESVILPEEPTIPGMMFTKWSEQIPIEMVAHNIVAYAEFVQLTYYTVLFVDFDRTVISTQTVYEGEAAVAPTDPIRTGYTFIGWDTDFSEVASDLVVTAQYEINTFTVTFISYDGTIIDTQTVDWGNSATPPVAPDRYGYDFAGWDTDFSHVESDLTVTAMYTLKEYSVIFVDGLSTEVIDTITVEHGNTAVMPTPPEHNGYTFIGWDNSGENIVSSITITALYEKSRQLGDVNGDGTVNTGDAVMILRYSVGSAELTDDKVAVADINSDGNVNTGDAVAVLRVCVGLVPSESAKHYKLA